MAPVDGLIVVRSTATSNVERVPVDTLTINDISRAIQSDGNYVRTSQRMSVQRQITVNTSIRLTNAMTGVVQSSYSTPKSQKDKARPGFLVGDNMAEADLPAGAEVVQNLLEEQVIDFVGEIVGTHKRGAAVRISTSGNPDCQAGVRYLDSESWSAALESFRRAIDADPSDHRALFGAGVACEMMGRNDDALSYYEKAVGLNGAAMYGQAARRVRNNRNSS
jgi:tetratricopeptide (TPR) repeat protein